MFRSGRRLNRFHQIVHVTLWGIHHEGLAARGNPAPGASLRRRSVGALLVALAKNAQRVDTCEHWKRAYRAG
jgi:hypothetical protein